MESLVSKIRKNANAELWVALREFHGKQYVDVREHFLSGDDRDWHPTKKGVMIEPELLPAVIDSIDQIDGSKCGLLRKISRSETLEIHIGFREFQRHNYGEVRVYYLDGKSNEMRPSPKGFTFKLDMKEPLIEALRESEDQLA